VALLTFSIYVAAVGFLSCAVLLTTTRIIDTSAVDATTLDSSWIDVHGDGGVMKKVIREGVGEVVLQGKSVSGTSR